ncbi:MAG: 5-formyltetrahydrofolate cyclo-ligase [Opitutales bacterium]|nr:5-formyltetrahydrofolate cyclo-ligase [Opitutales bacterium]
MPFPSDKDELRKRFRRLRRQILPADAKTQAEKIIEILFNWQPFSAADRIACYVSFGDELDTRALIDKMIGASKTVCVPKVAGTEIVLKQIRVPEQDLVPGFFNIPEPAQNCQTVDPAFPQIHIVPALAFDRHGNRLGYGRGFYDRFLKQIDPNARAVVIGYDCQFCDSVPADENDCPLQFFATPSRGIVPAANPALRGFRSSPMKD